MPRFVMPMFRRGSLWLSLAFVAAFCATAPVATADPEVDRGVRLFEQRKDAEARAALTPAATAKPPNATAAFYLGRLAMRADDAKEAARWFEIAAKLQDNNPDVHVWLGRAYGQQAQSAGKLSQIGLAKKTKAEFEKASTLDPNNLDARDALIQYYLMAPGIMGGSVVKAKEQAAEIRKRDAYRATMADATIAEDQKDLAGAEKAMKTAMQMRPDSLGPRYQLGGFYSRNERWDEAFTMYEDILKKKPDEWNALYAIGRTGAASGQRLDRAQAALEKFLESPRGELAPKPAPAHWRLGMIHEKAGRKDAARAEYQKALAIDPKFDEAKKSLGKLK